MQDSQRSARPARPPAQAGEIPHFTPVRLRGRIDGWTPERQRLYVAALARTGSARSAAAEVGLTEQSAGRLRRRPEAAEFARACEAACRIGKIGRRSAAARPPAFFAHGAPTL